jgi:hypothetical protein
VNVTRERSPATTVEIQAAIEALNEEELLRIGKAASSFAPGTQYADPAELFNEAITRCMSAAAGKGGRPWPVHVPFVAFVIKTMQGLASDSRESWEQRSLVAAEDLASDDQTGEQFLELRNRSELSTEELAIERQEAAERESQAQRTLEALRALLAGNQAALDVLDARLAELSMSEALEMFDLTKTQYESAQRALRRALEKLNPLKDDK